MLRNIDIRREHTDHIDSERNMLELDESSGNRNPPTISHGAVGHTQANMTSEEE